MTWKIVEYLGFMRKCDNLDNKKMLQAFEISGSEILKFLRPMERL